MEDSEGREALPEEVDITKWSARWAWFFWKNRSSLGGSDCASLRYVSAAAAMPNDSESRDLSAKWAAIGSLWRQLAYPITRIMHLASELAPPGLASRRLTMPADQDDLGGQNLQNRIVHI